MKLSKTNLNELNNLELSDINGGKLTPFKAALLGGIYTYGYIMGYETTKAQYKK